MESLQERVRLAKAGLTPWIIMKKDGLTFEQERAAQLLSLGKKLGDRSIAEKVGISLNTLRSWKSDMKFKVRVMMLFEENLEYERLERVRKIKKYLKPIYKRLEEKLSDPKLTKSVPLRELMRMMTQLHGELRLDKVSSRRASFEKEEDGHGGKPQIPEGHVDPLSEARALYTAGRREEANSKKVVPLFKE